jgi:exopolysaccharide biosynthesis WecB/TagA/CpsF family protein
MDSVVPRLSFLGLDFDDQPLPVVVARVLARPAAAPFAYVVTPNSDHLARLRRHPELRPLYENAWMCLLDSRLLANLADRLRLRRPALAGGADLVAALLPELPSVRVAVIGLTSAEMSALRARFPVLDWHHHEPPMDLRDNPAAFQAAADFAAATRACITFIALGAPLQERLAAAIAARAEATGLGLCIGAALSFAAGAARRAPLWMQRAGLEWLHRLAREPRRLGRRYLWDDPPILAALLAAALRRVP